MGHYDSCYEYNEEQKKAEVKNKKPTMMIIDRAETSPLYLRIVEQARAMTTNESYLTSEEKFIAAIIAVAFEYGKNAK